MRRAFPAFVTLMVSCASVLSAQQSEDWHPLARRQAEDVTGKSDTAQVDARKLGAGVYVVRTVYQRTRFTSSGKAWQTKYLTATIDCEGRMLSVMRMDYYNGDSFLEALADPSPKIPADMVAKMGGEFRDAYAFACGVDRLPPSR